MKLKDRAPPMFLSVPCSGPMSEPKTDCLFRIEIRVPVTKSDLDALAKDERFFLTLANPPDQGRVVLAVLCSECAPQVMAPELLEAAKQHRQKKRGGN